MSGYLGLDTDRERVTFGGFVADLAERYGDREALIFGDRRITFRQLEAEVRRFARALLAVGITKGSSVALMLANRPEFVIAAYGAGSIGAVVVPVSTFAPSDERDYILRHSDAAVLVTQASLFNHAFVDELLAGHPELAHGVPGQLRSPAFPFLRRIISLDPSDAESVELWDDVVARADEVTDELLDAALADVHPRDPGIIIYTSGTSANPKGVLHANGTPAIQGWRWGKALGLTPDDKLLSKFPYFWSAGLTMTLGGPLSAGTAVITIESFDAGTALEIIERERVTALQSMPETYNEIVEHPDFRSRDLSSLTLAVGAEPLVAALPDRAWRAQANGYGLTETFTLCTWAEPEETGGDFRTVHGRPLPGIDLRIVDPETGVELPTGQLGEIAVKGVTFMLGYYKGHPEEYLDHNGYFRTGDSGHLDDDGILHWGGRLTTMIKTGGANVSPVEIESKLSRWGRLKVATVVPVPHPLLDEAVVLCATCHDDDPVTGDEVLGHLKSVLASYKVPQRVVFVDEHELSYTATEKVKLAEARRLAARHIAADDPAWAEHLRSRHADLLAEPAEAGSS
jgi:acyl-CoA synthetase (AMP-forming)/AMP-acid ligase II